MTSHLERVREEMANRQVGCLLVTRPQNIWYLTGVEGLEGCLVVSPDKANIITDFRYIEVATDGAPQFKVVNQGISLTDAINACLLEAKADELWFEDDHVTVKYHVMLKEKVNARLTGVSGVVEKTREIKDDDEIATMQKATDIAEAAFADLLPQIRAGLTESEVAVMLEFAMRKHGADGVAFETISASGPRSSLPHGVPTDRVLQKGDLFTLDFGARYHGYCSDMTRTVVLGEPTDEQRKIYNIVYEAHMKSLNAAHAGMLGKELDGIARKIIEDAGYGQYFGHSLGHGVGRAIHEAPNASPRSEGIFAPGMTVTIEPGIYIPGFGGVRIEDMIVFTNNGFHNFNHSDKKLVVIPA